MCIRDRSIVHHAAHGRIGIARHFHQVQAQGLGLFQRVARIHDAEPVSYTHLEAAANVLGKIPLAGSVAIGVILFLVFLSICADGNPVVASVRTAINKWFWSYCSWLVPDMGTVADILLWCLGALAFGIAGINITNNYNHNYRKYHPK